MTTQFPTRGRYVLVEELDGGGMGDIFLALQRTSLSGVERLCVVKTVLPELIEHDAMRSRFLDEAKTSLMLQHKNICTTFDVEESVGTILLAMTFPARTDIDTTSRGVRARADVAPASSPLMWMFGGVAVVASLAAVLLLASR